MRVLFALGSSAAALALAVAAAAKEPPKPASPPAPHGQPQPPRTAGQYGAPTAFRGSTPGHGYSAQSRHMADCLATYPGYDPSRDRIVDATGASRRCEL
jgi:hypothetical protein